MQKLRKKEKEKLLKIFIVISAILCIGMFLTDIFELLPTVEIDLSHTAVGQLMDSGLFEKYEKAKPEIQQGFEEIKKEAEEGTTKENEW